MNLIYIQLPEGQQTAYEEDQVYEMLAQGDLSREVYFWKESMPEWRPLAELPPREADRAEPTRPEEKTVAPPRRTPKSAPDFKPLVKSFQNDGKRAGAPVLPHDSRSKSASRQEDEAGYWRRKAAGRFYFRVNPVPLTVCLQILMVLSISAALFLIYECLDKIYGWSNPDSSMAMTKLLGAKLADANPAGVSVTDMTFSNQFLCVLSGLQLLVEMLFYLWVYYANKNSRGFSNNILFTSAWAVAYFFIPFVNLFRPYQVMQEIWKVSEDPRSWLGRRDSIFVGVWFLLRVSILVLSNQWLYNTSEVGYLAVMETDIVLIEASTLILITLVIWRQVRWVRKRQV
jgi:hypothetical protein